MRSVRVAFAMGLVLMAIAVGVVLAGSPVTVAGTNSIPDLQTLGFNKGGNLGCVKGGTLPRGTSSVRLSLGANIGPRVSVKIRAGSRVVAHGVRGSGWGIGETVTVPVTRVRRAIPNVLVCVTLGGATEPVEIRGAKVRLTTPTGETSGVAERFRVEYLRRGQQSWWSRLSSVADRMGFGHAARGAWVVFLELALMIAAAALALWLILGATGGRRERPAASPRAPGPASVEGGRLPRRLLELPRRIPTAAWICALVAVLSAATWSLISPPFQVPDEPSHFAYVQWLAESGGLPTNSNAGFSQEEQVALRDLHQQAVRFFPEREPISSRAEQQTLNRDLSQPLERTGEGGAGVASSQPPLYYALQTIPYFVGSGGTLLDRLQLMRLLSVLMAGLTGLFGYLFVREALPGVRWAWSVGGLGIALMPLLGLMSGAVNPDSMFFAVSTATFFLLARAFRAGLTLRLAVAIGVALAIGSLTKLNFVGLAPGVIVGLVLLSVRAARTSGATAYRFLALSLGIAAAPACIYILRNLATGRPTLGLVSNAVDLTSGHHGSPLGEISYIWQFYLPRLPGMATDFPGVFPLRAIWFNRSIGLYGWLDTQFPDWLYSLALLPAAVIVLLAIRMLIRHRAALRRRVAELAVYALIAAGLVLLTGADSYLNFPRQAGRYGEPRYLLPLIALLGLVLALAARGAGRRWGRAVGVLLVILFLAWNVFSQLQVIARFYG